MSELYKAILAVMGEVGYVQKQGRVQGGGMNYRFAGEADLLRALRPAMVAHGLCMMPIGCDLFETHEMLETKYGPKPSRTVRVVSSYRLAHASGDFVDLQVAGEGQDKGDKATAKAMTIALKYAIRQAFLIETGDDPDVERPESQYERPSPPVSKPQSATKPPVGTDWTLLAREESRRAGATPDTIDAVCKALVAQPWSVVSRDAEGFVRALRGWAEVVEKRDSLPPGEGFVDLAEYILSGDAS